MGCRMRTGRPIIERTRALQPLPCLEPTRGQTQEPQECPQRHKHTGAIHCSQNSGFIASVGQAFVRQRESRASKQRDSQAKEGGELLHAPPELQDFLFELRCVPVRHVQADHDLLRRLQPPTGRRARDAEIRGDGHVPRALDEIPKAVVVPALMACRGRHKHDHRRFAYAAQVGEKVASRPPTLDAEVARTRLRRCRMSVDTAGYRA